MKPIGLIKLGILPLLLVAMTPAHAQHDQREQESRRPNQEQQARPERAQPQHQEQRQERPQQQRQERPQPQRPAAQEHAQPARAQEGRQRPQEARPAPARQDAPTRARGQQERPQQAPRAQPEPRQRPQEARGRQDQARQPQAGRPAPQAQRETAHRNVWQEHRATNFQSEHRTWQDRGGYRGYRIPDARYRGHFGPSHRFRMSSFPLIVVGGFPRFQYGGYWFSVMDPWPEYWSANWYGSDDLYVDYWGGGYYLYNRRHPMDRIAITVFVN